MGISANLFEKMNIQHRTSNIEYRMEIDEETEIELRFLFRGNLEPIFEDRFQASRRYIEDPEPEH